MCFWVPDLWGGNRENLVFGYCKGVTVIWGVQVCWISSVGIRTWIFKSQKQSKAVIKEPNIHCIFPQVLEINVWRELVHHFIFIVFLFIFLPSLPVCRLRKRSIQSCTISWINRCNICGANTRSHKWIYWYWRTNVGVFRYHNYSFGPHTLPQSHPDWV